MSDQVAIIKGLYEAFGTGDIPAILDCLADDIQWDPWADNTAQAAGVPWLQPRTGKAGVLEFFQIVGTLKVSDFRVISLMAGENQVAAEIEIVTERFRDQECHLWRFNGAGKVERMRHYVDTAKHAAAAAKVL
jgi:ketosteroid isomerase-like protein